jgi:hypothetical protein
MREDFYSSPDRKPEFKAGDLCRLMIAAAIVPFFGISVWILLSLISDNRVYWVLDVVSV